MCVCDSAKSSSLDADINIALYVPLKYIHLVHILSQALFAFLSISLSQYPSNAVEFSLHSLEHCCCL